MIGQSGAFLRNPAGGVEDVSEMANAGHAWLTVNVGDGLVWEDWRIVVDRARAWGVVPLPWARCRTIGDCAALLDVGQDVGWHAVLNIEDEFQTDVEPGELADLLDGYVNQSAAFDVTISTVAWLYNDVDFTPLANIPVLLQIFPQDNRWDPADLEQKQADCIFHAREKGFKHVGITYQTYGAAVPAWYAYESQPRSYYTGDDIGFGNWDKWPT